MPNKCTSCGKFHEVDAHYLLEGCDECGSKFFFFVKDGNVRVSGKVAVEEVKVMEQQDADIQEVAFDLEAIKVVEPGKYFLDLGSLFKQKPVVISTSPGQYSLDLSVLVRPGKK